MTEATYQNQIARLQEMKATGTLEHCICLCFDSVLLHGGGEIWRNGRKITILDNRSSIAKHFDACPICGRDITQYDNEPYSYGNTRV